MPSLPSSEVTWDDNDTDTTAPTTAEEADGHAVAATLSRQKINWIFRNLGQWARWLFQSRFRSDDLFTDGISCAHTNTPGTGAGLGPVAAGDFSARVFVNGHAVGPISSSAYTYTASRDHYWDLDQNGLWTAVVVTNGAAEPAVTSNAVRCFKVVTDATDRTSVVDYTDTALEVDQPLRFTQTRYAKEGSGVTRHLVEQDVDNSDASLPTRVYRSTNAVYGAPCREVAVNAVWNEGGSTWSADDTGEPSYLYCHGREGTRIYARPAGAGTWTDAVSSGNWVDYGNGARGYVGANAGAAISEATHNIASVAISSPNITVTFTVPMPDTNYNVVISPARSSTYGSLPYVPVMTKPTSTASFSFRVYDSLGAGASTANLASVLAYFSVQVEA